MKKAILLILSILTIGCLATGCSKTDKEPSKEVRETNVELSNKDGDTISTALKTDEYVVVKTDAGNLYDIQVKDNKGIVVMSGQIIAKDDIDYFRSAYTKDIDESLTTVKECNGVKYTLIPQNDTQNECSVFADVNENNGIMFYSFRDIDETADILNSLTLTIDKNQEK